MLRLLESIDHICWARAVRQVETQAESEARLKARFGLRSNKLASRVHDVPHLGATQRCVCFFVQSLVSKRPLVFSECLLVFEAVKHDLGIIQWKVFKESDRRWAELRVELTSHSHLEA